MTYWHGIPSGADEQKLPWWVVIHYGDVTVANNCRICRRKKRGRLTNFEKLQVIGFEELSYLRAKLPSFQIATGSLNVQQSINATNFQR